MKTTTKISRKTTTLKTAAPAKTKLPTLYAGAPIPATKVYRRGMEGFSRKQGNQCEAQAWLLINEAQGTVTYANSYNEAGTPKASYDPGVYTFPIKAKVVAKKIEAMIEVEADQWPAWITSAVLVKRTSRRAK